MFSAGILCLSESSFPYSNYRAAEQSVIWKGSLELNVKAGKGKTHNHLRIDYTI